jgi:hypothetical protein
VLPGEIPRARNLPTTDLARSGADDGRHGAVIHGLRVGHAPLAGRFLAAIVDGYGGDVAFTAQGSKAFRVELGRIDRSAARHGNFADIFIWPACRRR